MASRGPAPPLADYSSGKWCGDCLFLAGVVAADPESGRVVEGYDDLPPEALEQLSSAGLATGAMSVDSKEGPVAAQAWFVLDRVRRLLVAEGLSLDNVAKLTQYMTDLRDFPVYNRVRLLFWPENPPASTVVQVSALLPTESSRLEVDVVAFRGIPKGVGA
jgi:enamine deaminase RidA (YjgF/YER057c/UK114 family)